MSEYEGYVGKMTPVDLGDKTLDEWIKDYLKEDELPDYYENWIEFFGEKFDGNYYYNSSDNILYKIDKKEVDPSFFVVSRKVGDSYEFATAFHNGGTGLYEMCDEIITGAEEG